MSPAFVDRCGAMCQLTNTRSPCRLTRCQAIVVQKVDRYVKVLQEVSQYMRAIKENQEEFELFLDAIFVEMDVDEGGHVVYNSC